MSNHMTAKQAAEYACLPLETILALLNTGELPAARAGSEYLIEREAMDALMAGTRSAVPASATGRPRPAGA